MSSSSGFGPWSRKLCFQNQEMNADGTGIVFNPKIYFPQDTIKDNFMSHFPEAKRDTLLNLKYYTCSGGIHGFLLIETKSGYWTLEKNSKGITLQHGEDSKAVLNFFGNEARKGPIRVAYTIKKFIKPDVNMTHVIEQICRKKELLRGYRLLLDNCRDFANRMVEGLCTRASFMEFFRNVIVAGKGHIDGPLGYIGKAISL